MYEPHRIKVVEPLTPVPLKKRQKALRQAGYNPFFIPANLVTIDLISDSGTGAMSAHAWAEMIKAREDFSGQKSYHEFVRIAQQVFGLPYIQPVHQGRVSENILFKILLRRGDIVLSNTHFETTRANIETLGCKAIDLSISEPPFCGNMDIKEVERIINRSKRVRIIILTLTNNINGGQPVSFDNIRQVRKVTKRENILLIFDASRFAGNIYLNKKYNKLRQSIKNLCKKQFDLCDIAYLSCKKDGLVNIGGMIGLRDKKLFDELQTHIIQQESYPSAGGLAARDLAAMKIGLQEAINENFLCSHITSIRYLAEILKEQGVTVFEPIGAHAIVIEPKTKSRYAAFAFAAQVYLASGVRGGVFDNKYRLAIPRRVYTNQHLRYVGEVVGKVYKEKPIKFKPTNRPKSFHNFFVKFKKVR